VASQAQVLVDPESVLLKTESPESTVMKHLEHVDVRSGVHSRTQAVRLCEPALS
jgi:hypothetical protein